MHITKRTTIVENDALKLAWCAENSHEIEAVYNVTPFDELAEKQDRETVSIGEREETEIRLEGVRRLLIYLFDGVPNALEVTKKIFVLCYTIAPELLPQFGTLDSIAKQFDQTRQAFSKRLINQNKELNLRSRNQKSETAVQTYREVATAGHAARIDEERAEKRKTYSAAWRKAHAAEIKAYQAIYRAKHRDRLNRVRREERETKRR
jgi:hypothetical protein